MAKITHEREKCIGCGACASVCPKFFEMADDGKADLIGGKKKGAKFELEVKGEHEADCAKEAAEGCPVECIHVE